MNYSESNSAVCEVTKDDEGTRVAAAKAGDVAAFEELVGRYERKIFRLAVKQATIEFEFSPVPRRHPCTHFPGTPTSLRPTNPS